MTITDTSVLIDYLAGRATPQTDWMERSVDAGLLGITDLILYEVLQGVRDDKAVLAVQKELRPFQLWPTFSPGLEVKAAANYRNLRGRGITVRKAVDCLLATFCIEGGHELIHNDRDFEGFERFLGLKAIHPELS